MKIDWLNREKAVNLNSITKHDQLQLQFVKKLASGETEASGIQGNYAKAPSRIYYRLTQKGKEATDELWSNPLFTLYPEVSLNHLKKAE